jgi:hypothetical protein
MTPEQEAAVRAARQPRLKSLMSKSIAPTLVEGNGKQHGSVRC